MRIVSADFIEAFGGKYLNTHPALLPAFPGAHGVRDALAYGVKVTGCTVHWADAGVDTGPIIAQEAVTRGGRRHRGNPARTDQDGGAPAAGFHAGKSLAAAAPIQVAGHAKASTRRKSRVSGGRQIEYLRAGCGADPGHSLTQSHSSLASPGVSSLSVQLCETSPKVLCLTAALVLGTGAVSAANAVSTTSGTGEINGCYNINNGGQLRVLAPGASCDLKKETAIARNCQGIQGIQGIAGPSADPGLSRVLQGRHRRPERHGAAVRAPRRDGRQGRIGETGAHRRETGARAPPARPVPWGLLPGDETMSTVMAGATGAPGPKVTPDGALCHRRTRARRADTGDTGDTGATGAAGQPARIRARRATPARPGDCRLRLDRAGRRGGTEVGTSGATGAARPQA